MFQAHCQTTESLAFADKSLFRYVLCFEVFIAPLNNWIKVAKPGFSPEGHNGCAKVVRHLGCCCENSSGQIEHQLIVMSELGAQVHRGLELPPYFVFSHPWTLSDFAMLISPVWTLTYFPSNWLTISTCLYFKRKGYYRSYKWQSSITIKTRPP